MTEFKSCVQIKILQPPLPRHSLTSARAPTLYSPRMDNVSSMLILCSVDKFWDFFRAAKLSCFSHFFWRAENLLKLLPMIGMGRAITNTPKIAQKHPRIFPNPVIGDTSPYPT